MITPLPGYHDLQRLQSLRDRAANYGSVPQWFGLGFIQLKLSETERMHFWTPDIPNVEREEIHNHRYSFNSIVLAGTLKHLVFQAWEDPNGVHELFQTACAPGKEGVVETTTPYSIRFAGVYNLPAGSTYYFPHRQFHSTQETHWAITFLRREKKVKEFADVIKGRGALTVCPFKETLPVETCWLHIEKALERLQSSPVRSLPCRRCGTPTPKFVPLHQYLGPEDEVCGYCGE